MSRIYVTVDIGCIECGESTAVTRVSATPPASMADRGYFSGGQHSVETFECEVEDDEAVSVWS